MKKYLSLPKYNDLAIQWLNEEIKDGIVLKSFRYTCLKLNCGDITIFGTYGYPKGQSKLPAILHIHGGGQTNDPEAVLEWCKAGYSSMSFDWTGDRNPDRPKDQISFYPKGFEEEMALHLFDAKRAFVGILAARNCISILTQMSEVNEDKIGIYGISWGGFITWLVNAHENRIKCAVPIYGTGGLFRRGHCWNQSWQTFDHELKYNWLNYMEPSTSISPQNSPILHINASNDFFGGIDIAGEMLPRIDGRVDFTPNNNHNFSPTSVELIRRFFAQYLKNEKQIPKTPILRFDKLKANSLEVITEQDGDNTELWYSYGNSSHEARCWDCRSDWTVDGNKLKLKLDFNTSVWMYVRKFYDNSKVSISSHPICMEFNIEETKSDNILYLPGSIKGLGWEMGTEMRDSVELNQRYQLSDSGISVNHFGEDFPPLIIRTPNDPKCRNYPAKELEIVVSGVKTIEIICIWNRGVEPFGGKYLSTVAPDKSTIYIKPDMFKNEQGHAMQSFKDVQYISISGQSKVDEKFMLKHLKWSRNISVFQNKQIANEKKSNGIVLN